MVVNTFLRTTAYAVRAPFRFALRLPRMKRIAAASHKKEKQSIAQEFEAMFENVFANVWKD
ncbi:MAG TPA: hypothetical protein VK171_00040 [Fimbriimonas sp.]|nr:hypothetical protein [Fimbriimonas sp.]